METLDFLFKKKTNTNPGDIESVQHKTFVKTMKISLRHYVLLDPIQVIAQMTKSFLTPS